jgi:hypothetical protein
MGGRPPLSHTTTLLWKPVLKTSVFKQLSPTLAEYRFYEGVFPAGSLMTNLQKGFCFSD